MAPQFNSKSRASELVPHYAEKIKGKTILVTGVSTGGIGEGFTKNVAAAKPAALILAGRNPAKFQSLLDTLNSEHPEINVKPLPLDLGSFDSVRKAAAIVNDTWTDIPSIDVLVLNAGIMAVPYSKTEDGFESQLQVNHLSHFLFTNLIMGKVLASPSPRVVSISSSGHRAGPIRWSDPNFGDGKYYDRWSSYGQAKTANNLMAISLAEKLGGKGMFAYSVHPGFVASNLAGHVAAEETADFLADLSAHDAKSGSRYMFIDYATLTPKDLDEGSATHVFGAFDDGIATAELNGSHLVDCHVADPYNEEIMSWAASKIDAERLWLLSEKLIGQEFKY